MFFISCSNSKKIIGRIYVLGNEPFIKYGIENSEGVTYIIMKDSPVYKRLNKLQGKKVLGVVDMQKSLSWDVIYITKIIIKNKE